MCQEIASKKRAKEKRREGEDRRKELNINYKNKKE
jgi:hypothetical protein